MLCPFGLKDDMPTCNQETSTFQIQFECALDLEVNSNHNFSFMKRNILIGEPLTLTHIPPILIIIILREIIIAIITFTVTNSLTLDNTKQ